MVLMSLSGGLKKDDLWTNLKLKISWHCPFINMMVPAILLICHKKYRLPQTMNPGDVQESSFYASHFLSVGLFYVDSLLKTAVYTEETSSILAHREREERRMVVGRGTGRYVCPCWRGMGWISISVQACSLFCADAYTVTRPPRRLPTLPFHQLMYNLLQTLIICGLFSKTVD